MLEPTQCKLEVDQFKLKSFQNCIIRSDDNTESDGVSVIEKSGEDGEETLKEKEK